MKVITIKEPFATLIKEGLKEYEFRTWKTNYRGKIIIHAGKGIDKKAIVRFKDYNLKYHSGEIIAISDLTDCIKVDKDFREILKKTNALVYAGVINDTDWEGYAFKLENIRKVEPTSVNGKLSLWDYEYNLEEKY